MLLIRLKKKKIYVSKLVTDWKTWPKCGFFNAGFFFFFFFFFFFLSSWRFKWVGHITLFSMNMELEFWMNNLIQDRTQSWRSLLFKVSYYVCHVFSSIFWQASSLKKNWKQNKQAKKKLKAWILLIKTRTEKQTRAAALRHTIYFFSLIFCILVG